MCYATQEAIQSCFRSEMFQRCTVSEYESNISGISRAVQNGKTHCRGVKRYCLLNNIQRYQVTENWSLDIKHILLEGIMPVELGCILYCLCV